MRVLVNLKATSLLPARFRVEPLVVSDILVKKLASSRLLAQLYSKEEIEGIDYTYDTLDFEYDSLVMEYDQV